MAAALVFSALLFPHHPPDSAFLGVLQEGTQNDADANIWQFYYNGYNILETSFWQNYKDIDDTDMGRQCLNGGRALLILELFTLFAVTPAWILTTVRILGVHISLLQPAAKWLNVEFYFSLAALVGQFFSCVVWGFTCFHASSQLTLMAEMTPTGYIWLILCAVYYVAIFGIYWILRSDPALVLGSVYGGHLHDTENNASIAQNPHGASDTHHFPPSPSL